MSKIKVLIVDDSKIEQKLFDVALSDSSYEKQFADNGEEAWKAYQSWHPDIILLDLIMPVKSGYATLKDIRQSEEKSEKKTAVIIATVMSDKQDIVDCSKLGVQGYMVKPFKVNEVHDLVMKYYNEFKKQFEK